MRYGRKISVPVCLGIRWTTTVLKLVLPLFLLGHAAVALANPDRLLDRLERERRPGYVFDFARVLSDQHAQAITSILHELEQRTGTQVKVVTLTSLEGGQIDDVANRLFERWGLGRQDKDNGVLLLAAMQERRVRIEVGYGLEGALPDARAGRILDQIVLPAFRQGKTGAGLVAGTAAIANRLAANAGVTLVSTDQTRLSRTVPTASRENKGMHPLFGLLIMIAFVYLAIRHPLLFLLLIGSGMRGGRSGGGFGGGGFGGGFGGGLSGGGGASRGW